jgi:oxygen-independent coproporphyrinogen-3 oxidase
VSYFQNKFDVNVTERFRAPLRQLEAEGFLRVTGDEIRYTRAGLLQVDSLLPDFFLEQHRS